MSGWFILALIAGSVTLLLAGAAALLKLGDEKISMWPAVVGVLLTGALLFIASATTVPTRSVGVATSFGKASAKPLANGFHFVAPWKRVEKLSTATQTLKLDGSDSKDRSPCVTVRLANQTTACVDVSVQWNIDDRGVVDLYRQYKPREGDVFSNIEDNLVKRQVTHALNVAFASYDPLAAINGKTGETTVKPDDLATKAREVLQAAVGAGILVRSLTIPIVHYDQTTQDKLNAYAQALADTRIAQQREATAEAQKRANEALAGSSDPSVLYQNCLDMTERLAKEGKGLPAAWSCGAPPQAVVPVR